MVKCNEKWERRKTCALPTKKLFDRKIVTSVRFILTFSSYEKRQVRRSEMGQKVLPGVHGARVKLFSTV